MLCANVFTSIVLFLGLTLAAPGPSKELMARDGQELETRECIIGGGDTGGCHGERTCVAGGISCQYKDGSRCAKFTSHGKSFTGWCPDGHWDKGVYHDGYSGAACISLLAVLGRHHCS